MPVEFLCPSCRKAVPAHTITAVKPANHLATNPDWQCRCGGTASRQSYQAVGAGPSPGETYLCPNLSKKSLPKPKVVGPARSFVEKKTFAGGDYATIRKAAAKTQFKPGVMLNYFPVRIYIQDDQQLLTGQFFTPTARRYNKVVLLLSGSGGVAAEYFDKVIDRYLKRVGVPILMVDYRGFGGASDTKPSMRGVYADAEAMYRYLTDDKCMGGLGYLPGDVVIHGYSLGTGVAAELATRLEAAPARPYAGLILQCPWVSAAHVAASTVDNETAQKLAYKLTASVNKMDVKDKMLALRSKILMLTAIDDEVMDTETPELLKAVAGRANITTACYDGEHKDPHNAFKDGRGATVADWGTGNPTGETAAKGKMVLDPKGTSTNPRIPAMKQSKGIGCIATINQWYGNL